MSYKARLIVFLFMMSLCGPTICWALVDPTMPSDEDASFSSNEMSLTAIMIWPDRRLAVINGKILHEGDAINNSRVIKIEANTVEMRGPDGVFSLQLLTYPLKRVK